MLPSFAQLIDLAIVRPLMQTFSRTSGLPMAIIDQEGKVLASSGWQRVCTYFHRRFPLPVSAASRATPISPDSPTMGARPLRASTSNPTAVTD